MTKKAERLTCGYCNKEKKLASFYLAWQKKNLVCNYCSNFKAVSIYGNPDKNKIITRACLCCDKSFSTNMGYRICDVCKNKEDYQIGSRYSDMVTGQVC